MRISSQSTITCKRKWGCLAIVQVHQHLPSASSLAITKSWKGITQGRCPSGYRLQNSRGVTYVRTVVLDGAVLQTSGSDGCTALWTRLCTHQSGRDITSEVENAMKLSAK